VIGAVAVGLLLAGGGVLGAVAVSGGDDSEPSGEAGRAGGESRRDGADAGLVDSASGSEIVQVLEDAGYACYDSLDAPVVRRCFTTVKRSASGSRSGPAEIDLTVGLQTGHRDEVERFVVAAESKAYAWPLTDHGRLTAAARGAWRLVAPPIIGDADSSALADKLGGETVTRSDSAWGTATLMAGDQTVVRADVLADGVAPTPYEPHGVERSPSEIRSALVRRGFRCRGPTLCRRDGYDVQLSPEDAQAGLLGLSVETYPHASPPATVRVSEAVRLLEGMAADAGLDRKRVLALISDGFAEGRSTVTADIDGVNYSLSTWVDAGEVDLMRLQVLAVEW
jgi:hypothetical protein